MERQLVIRISLANPMVGLKLVSWRVWGADTHGATRCNWGSCSSIDRTLGSAACSAWLGYGRYSRGV